MNIPKGLVPKDSEERLTQVLKKPKIKTDTNYLFENYNLFLKKLREKDLIVMADIYQLAEEKVREVHYTEENVVNLVEEIELKTFEKINENRSLLSPFGYYLSALVNKIIKEEQTITLDLSKKRIRIDVLGAFLEVGTVIVSGSLGSYTGFKMNGGCLKVFGGLENDTGVHMTGGEIRVNGLIAGIDYTCKGTIYQCDLKVWPK